MKHSKSLKISCIVIFISFLLSLNGNTQTGSSMNKAKGSVDEQVLQGQTEFYFIQLSWLYFDEIENEDGTRILQQK